MVYRNECFDQPFEELLHNHKNSPPSSQQAIQLFHSGVSNEVVLYDESTAFEKYTQAQQKLALYYDGIEQLITDLQAVLDSGCACSMYHSRAPTMRALRFT